MTTDTSKKGLETRIIRHMTGEDGLAVPQLFAFLRTADWPKMTRYNLCTSVFICG
jgi:hypothetical protein